MTKTPSDYLADLFGLPPEPVPPSTTAEDAEAALAAAEAELAAEFGLAMEAGGVAADAPDSRSARRVRVSWPARMRLPGGAVVHVEVRNVSESGVGLMSGEDLPARTVVNFEMDVPRPDEPGQVAVVKGTIKTAYAVAYGTQHLCGGTWQAPPQGLEIVSAWIERLRG